MKKAGISFAELSRMPFFIYDCEHCDHSGSRCPKHWPMGQTLRVIKPERDRSDEEEMGR